jgi:hypothetical protein
MLLSITGNNAVGAVFPPAPASVTSGAAGGTGSSLACTLDDAAEAASSTALTAISPLDGCRSRRRARLSAADVRTFGWCVLRWWRALFSLFDKPIHPFIGDGGPPGRRADPHE